MNSNWSPMDRGEGENGFPYEYGQRIGGIEKMSAKMGKLKRYNKMTKTSPGPSPLIPLPTKYETPNLGPPNTRAP